MKIKLISILSVLFLLSSCGDKKENNTSKKEFQQTQLHKAIATIGYTNKVIDEFNYINGWGNSNKEREILKLAEIAKNPSLMKNTF